jgi:Domain of unknown function (DUF4129)
MGASRAPVTAVAAVVGGVLLVAVLVTWAASIGPSGVLQGEGPEAKRLTPSETTSLEAPTGESAEQVRDRLAKKLAGDHPILRAIALVLELVAGLAVLYVLFRLGRWGWQTFDARRRPDPPPEDVEFDVLEGPRRLAEEITGDAEAQRRVLMEGSPRNAIVECWHRFELQAAGAGLQRHLWETSSEFTLRMLDLVAADSHAVAELAVLYREARFSTHPLDEATRARAVADLDAIHAGLLAGRGRRA